ncbi:MAG: fibronectin type III domain-containing protein [Methanomassiliicoccales archaeon]
MASGLASGVPSAVLGLDGKFHVLCQTVSGVNMTSGKGSSWTTSVVENATLVYGGTASLAMDSKGHLDAVYYITHEKVLRYATNASGSWVLSDLASNLNADWCSIGLGANDVIQIAYNADGAMTFLIRPEGVWMVQTTNTGPGAVGTGDMALTPTGRALVSYYDYTSPGTLKLAEHIAVPSAPATLTVVRGNEQVQLNWTAPNDNGGAMVTSYVVYRGDAPDNLTMVTRLTSTHNGYLDAGLTNGAKYYYAVKASNFEGQGLRSLVANATPATVPSAPGNLVTAPGDGQIKLSWDVPSFDGGAQITQYRVYRGTDSTNLTYIGNTTGTTYTDSGLQNDRTYYYKVTAVNAMGEGVQSSLGQATPKVDNTLLIVGIAVVIVAAVGAVVYVMVRRRH